MEEEVSNNGGPWRARMNSRAPRQKEKKKKKKTAAIVRLMATLQGNSSCMRQSLKRHFTHN